MNEFKSGDRVKLSFDGRKLFTKHGRIGTIKRPNKRDADCVWLQWDGTQEDQSFHHHFLEIASPTP